MPERRTRLLPGPGAVIVLVLVLAVVAGISLVRHLGGGANEATTPAPNTSTSMKDNSAEDTGTEAESGSAQPVGPSAASPGATPVGTASAGRTVIVYITGHVSQPGVVELAPGSRVRDAVDQAGGLLGDADLQTINLARVVEDGEHITVWAQGEAPAGTTDSGVGTPGDGTSSGSAGAVGSSSGGGGSGCIDLNTADATALDRLDGVGPALAQRILDYRSQVGRITSVEQLDDVPGIGAALVQRISPGVCS